MKSRFQFLQYLQSKKKTLHNQKIIPIDLQQLEHRIQKPAVKTEQQKINISEQQFSTLIQMTKYKLMQQPTLLKIDGPAYIATGTYGSYKQLSLIFQKCGNPKFVNYLFLGNYTGVYGNGIQCLVALMIYKIKYPYNFFMLRGTGESLQNANVSGLKKQVEGYFSTLNVLDEICELFCCFPFACTIFDQIFCAHGGVSPYLFNLQQINKIHRPINTTSHGLPHQIVFSEPAYSVDQQQTENNITKFSQKDTERFLKRVNFKLICRGASIVQNGFQYIFNKTIVNICSISNFKNQFINSSAVLMVDDVGNVIAKQIIPSIKCKNNQNQEEQIMTF